MLLSQFMVEKRSCIHLCHLPRRLQGCWSLFPAIYSKQVASSSQGLDTARAGTFRARTSSGEWRDGGGPGEKCEHVEEEGANSSRRASGQNGTDNLSGVRVQFQPLQHLSDGYNRQSSITPAQNNSISHVATDKCRVQSNSSAQMLSPYRGSDLDPSKYWLLMWFFILETAEFSYWRRSCRSLSCCTRIPYYYFIFVWGASQLLPHFLF